MSSIESLSGEYIPSGDEGLSWGGDYWESQEENGVGPPGDSEDGHHGEDGPPYGCCSFQVQIQIY